MNRKLVWLAALLSGYCLLAALVWPAVFPTAPKNTVVFHAALALWPGRPLYDGRDSWRPMLAAYDRWSRRSCPSFYEQIFFREKIKMQYPPSSLALLVPLKALALSDEDCAAVLNFLSWWLLLGTLLATVRLFWLVLARDDPAGPSGPAPRTKLLLSAVIVLAGLVYYPLIKAYTLGQVQTWINFLFVLTLLSWLRGRKVRAGVIWALVCLIKPQYALLFVWSVWRREKDFSAAGLAVLAAGFGLTAAVFGWQNLWDYGRVLSHIGRYGEVYYANQSANGLFNRLWTGLSSLRWQADSFAPYHGWVLAGTLASSGLILGLTLWPPRRGAGRRTADLLAMVLAATLASPVAWEHHYGLLFPVLAVLAAGRLASRRKLGPADLVLAGAYVLTASNIYLTQSLDRTAWGWAQSYLFFGALLLWLYLIWARGQEETRPAG